VIRRLFGLVVFLLIAHATVRVGQVWIHYQTFKDGIRETVLFAGTQTDDALRDRVMALARKNSIPLDPNFVTIDRAGGGLTITASYVEQVQVLPGYRRPWQFDVVGR
jgi:hypothetical protein